MESTAHWASALFVLPALLQKPGGLGGKFGGKFGGNFADFFGAHKINGQPASVT